MTLRRKLIRSVLTVWMGLAAAALLHAQPHLFVGIEDSGPFYQGQVGAQYYIFVNNGGSASTSGLATVTDSLPSGVIPTSISGTNWNCTQPAGPCTRSDSLPVGFSYDTITLTVNVAGNAPPSVTDSATVSGGGTSSTNTNSDTVQVIQYPDVTIAKTHTPGFYQGQTGATYTITVSNVGAAQTEGAPITVTDTVPAGLVATSITGGSGWSCTQPAGPCGTSANVLPGSNLPPLTLTVNVASTAPSTVVNTATVSCGCSVEGLASTTASDLTHIALSTPTPVITSMGASPNSFEQLPPAITSGTPISSFNLFIDGYFDPSQTFTVAWYDPLTNTTTTLAPTTVTASQIVVSIPNSLFDTLVTVPDLVQVTVTETPPNYGAATPLSVTGRRSGPAPRLSALATTSNVSTFTILPPLVALGPNLPSGTVGAPYSQPYFTGGTPGYFIRIRSGALPDGLALSADGLTITGTPTKAGSFPFQIAVNDAWNNTITPNDTILITTGGPAPTITSVVPNSAAAGTSAVQITVNGTNFTPLPLPTANFLTAGSVVYWTAPGAAAVPLTTAFVSPTQLTASVPAALLAAARTVTITVAQSGGVNTNAPVTSNGLPFTVNPPSISSLTPPGATAGAPGFTLTVSGANFVNNASPPASTQIFFGGIPLTTTFVSASTLTVPITSAMIANPGPITVVAVNPGGSRSAAAAFTVFAAPTLLSLNPNSTVAGGPGFTLTVTGTNFTTGMSIRFNGTSLGTTCVAGPSGATTAVACASNQLSATVPAGLIASAGIAAVTVATPDGYATPSLPFTILPRLLITTTALPNGLPNVSYSFTLTATGGSSPYVWSASGLPSGFSVNPATGAITGTTTASGGFTVAVTVTDGSGQIAQAQFVLPIAGKLLITTTALPNGIVGTSYSFALTATGGVPPDTWSVTGLPAGLTPNSSTGAISGTPTASGTFTVSVSVSDTSQQTAAAQFSLTIIPKLAITTTALPNGIVGKSYSFTLTATGGVPADNWTVSGLPAGLTPNSSAGSITGTPTASGAFSVSVSVSDSGGQTATAQFTLTIIPKLVVTTTALPNGIVGTSYNFTLTATGGTAPDTWSVSGLPAGLTLNSATGAITGSPAAAGSTTASVTVSDGSGQTASASFPATVIAKLAITTTSLPSVVAGASYNFTLTATGGVTPYTWAVTGLPAGLTLNAATGAITGTPTTSGTPAVSVTVSDTSGQTASAQLALTVIGKLAITSGNLPGATAGSPFTFQLTATGGIPPYLWAATGLAPGLTLNPQTGLISGTPTAASSGVVSVTVTDNSSQTASAQFPYSTTPASPPPLQIVTLSLPAGTVGIPYGSAVAASGGSPGYTFALAGGALPGGLTLSTNGGIGGTPTAPGQFKFTVQVTDSNNATATRDYGLLINPGPLTITGSVNDVVLGAGIGFKFSATGGVAPYVFSASGAVPTGSKFTSDGSLSGTATAIGTFTFSVTATDNAGTTASKGFTIKVTAAPLVITTASLGSATVGVAFLTAFAATGGVPPYSWSGGGGGLGFSGNVLGGTPTAAGTFTVSVTVTDSVGTQASKSFTLTVASPLLITTASLPNGVLGAAYSASLSATGGVPPYSFSASGLPGGLSASSSGAISGTPTARGGFNVSATVTDANGTTASKSFSLTISPPPLTISTTTLPNATVGTAYHFVLQATGGVPPLTFSATGLPSGMNLASDGTLSGTPTAAGTANMVVTLSDSVGTTGSATIPLVIVLPPPPTVVVTGAPNTDVSTSQEDLKVSLDRSYPVDVNVTLNLTVAPVSGPPPQDVQFANGTQTVTFVVPANTAPTAQTDVFLQVGTVAGSITITEKLTIGTQDVTPSPAPTQTIQIAPAVPVLTGNPSVTATRNSAGFTVVATGYSNTREIQQVIFGFTAAAGSTLQTTQLTVAGSAIFTPYYQSAASNATGGGFKLTQPFTVQGSTQAIVSVTVTFVNTVGSSKAVTVNLQ